MLENVNHNHIRKVPQKISLEDTKNIDLMFNTPNGVSVLSEYQLASIKEVREHDYNPKNEYNLDGNIISEEEIVGSNGDFYIGFYSSIAYLQLRVCYRNDMVTIVRYRSADKDASDNEWNSDITFIIHHNAQLCRKAERNVNFRNLLELANELEKNGWNDFNRIYGFNFCENDEKNYSRLHYKNIPWWEQDEVLEEEIIEEIIEENK